MFQPGDEIDIWKVEKALGAGGMGSVYRCHNRSARRILAAIKVLDTSFTRNVSIRGRFVREAEILFSLDHPHIVKVRNVRIDAEPPYLEMEFVEGESLESRLSRGALPVTDALRIVTQVADALVYLHARAIRHRDIKPSNILVQQDGSAKLVDFGIATESTGATLSEGGQVFGSVAFVPPEWARPGELDPVLWDIYALGICLYEAVTGAVAFDISANGSPSQRFFQVIMAKQCHPPLEIGPDFPEPLRALVRAMTDSDAKRRIQTAAEVLRELKRLDHTGALRHDRPAGHADTVADTMHEVAPPRRSDPTWAEAPANRTLAPPPTPPPSSAPETPPRTESSRWPIVAAGIFAAAGALTLAGLAYRKFTIAPPVTHRDVMVITDGLGSYPRTLTMDGKPSVADGAGRIRFGPLEYGTHGLQARLGKDCDLSPLTCGTSETTLEVVRGEGVQEYHWGLSPPSPRPVTLTAPAGRFHAVLDGKDLGINGPFRLEAPPGRLLLRAEVGNCPSDLHSCDTGTDVPRGTSCPKGCTLWEGPLEILWGEGPLSIEVPLVASAPTTPLAKAPTKASGPVSNSALARWLKSHPEWLRSAMGAKADARYLSDWDGATPPVGKENVAAVNVSWQLAQAYCAGRGGLLSVEAEPLTWTESPSTPWHEYRQQSGKPAWRRSDGSVSVAVNPTESRSYIGFRCGG